MKSMRNVAVSYTHLCKGINDGEELERSIRDLMKYAPQLQSVSVVPVGLSKYRDGLYPLIDIKIRTGEKGSNCPAKQQRPHYPVNHQKRPVCLFT